MTASFTRCFVSAPGARRAAVRVLLSLGLLGGALTLLGGCAQWGYYHQSISGHLALVRAAKPVTEVLAQPDLDPTLRQQLTLSQSMRDYAISELHLPDNSSYRRYADLHRGAAVWNVVATPPLSLQLTTWCYPIMGCAGYRGYFKREDALALASQLKQEGLEPYVYGVPAYSSLGWSNWIGGDPLLNTFIQYPEGQLARMIFHELAHQVAYADDDTTFNESFATAVEQLGVARWLGDRPDALRPMKPHVSGRTRSRRCCAPVGTACARSSRAPPATMKNGPARRRSSPTCGRTMKRSSGINGAGTTASTAGSCRSTPRRWPSRAATPIWCRTSCACSSGRGGIGTGSMPRSSGWPSCPRTNGGRSSQRADDRPQLRRLRTERPGVSL